VPASDKLPRDEYGDWSPGVYTWLQAWYATQANGDWEHERGINISTLDNPGWTVEIDLAETDLSGRVMERIERHRSEHDWVVAWTEGDTYHAACGPTNLGEALYLFRELSGDIPPP
jgi:Immunity protein 53